MSVEEVRFVVVGDPVPWSPTKQNRRTGNRFLPDRQEAAIARNVAAMNYQLGDAARPIFGAGVPLLLKCTFWVKRPKAHYGTGRNADKLKASAPARPTGKPDFSNLVKMAEDCLKLAGVVLDDDQVVGHFDEPGKFYVPLGRQPQMTIRVRVAE